MINVVNFLKEFNDGDSWETDAYENFYKSAMSNKYSNLLVPHTLEEIKEKWTTFKMRNYNIGFALEYKGEDETWVNWLHSSEDIKGIGKLLVEKAISYGGTHLFNVDTPYLNLMYESCGFETYDRKPFIENYTHIYRKRKECSLCKAARNGHIPTPQLLKVFSLNPKNNKEVAVAIDYCPECGKKLLGT